MKSFILLLAIGLIISLRGMSAPLPVTSTPMTFFVDTEGLVTLNVSVAAERGLSLASGESLLLVMLPFPHRPSWSVGPGESDEVLILNKGSTFTLLSVIARKPVTSFQILGIKELIYKDGRAFLTISYAFSGLGQNLQSLMTFPFVYHSWSINVVFPEVYDDIKVNASYSQRDGNELKDRKISVPYTQNGRSIDVNAQELAKAEPSRVLLEIEFPDPRESKKKVEVLVADWWLSMVLVLLAPSAITFGATHRTLQKRWYYAAITAAVGIFLGFLGWVYVMHGVEEILTNAFYRASAPAAILSGVTALVIVVRWTFQGRAKGTIKYRGSPAAASNARLCYTLSNGTTKQLALLAVERGEYSVALWRPERWAGHKVLASIPGRTKEMAEPIRLVKGELVEVADIDLEPKEIAGIWEFDEEATKEEVDGQLIKQKGNVNLGSGLRDALIQWLSDQIRYREIEAYANGRYRMKPAEGSEEYGRWQADMAGGRYNLEPDGKRHERILQIREDGRARLEIQEEASLLKRVTLVVRRKIEAEVKDAP